MDRVKWNDFMEILSDDLNRSGDYLIEGFQNMVSDFISTGDVTVGLAVTAQAVPNMSVYVKKGRLYQNGQQGNLANDSNALTIAAAHSSYARIDRVVAQYQAVEDLPETRNVMTDVVSRNISQQTVKTRIAGMVVFQVLQGVAAASPVPVSVPEGWVALAKINVPANATKIQQNNIVSEAPELFNLLNHNHNGAGGGQKISYKNLTDTPAKATKEDAEKGTDDNKVMTPLRTKQAVEKFAPLKTVNGQSPDDSGNVDVSDTTPVGDVVYRPYLRAGYVKANGATVNRADYPNLVSFATDNNLWTDNPTSEPWKYGRGNGSTTMVLPDYRNRFIQGGDNAKVVQAGLPNILGEISCKTSSAFSTGNQDADNLSFSGAFTNSTKGGRAHNTDVSNFANSLHSINLNANLSSSIYGSSSTVQPPAIVLVPQIRF